MIKILVTNINFYNKNYLILTNFKKSNKGDTNYKKIKNSYSFLITDIVSVFVSIIHSNVSPFLRSSKSLANAGTVVVSDPATDCTFVVYFNCIPPIYRIISINKLIFIFKYIYSYLYRKLYIISKHNINYHKIL